MTRMAPVRRAALTVAVVVCAVATVLSVASSPQSASPQLELIELDDAQWIKVQQRAFARRTKRITAIGEQLAFVGLGTSALIFFYLQAMEEVGRTCFPHVSCVM